MITIYVIVFHHHFFDCGVSFSSCWLVLAVDLLEPPPWWLVDLLEPPTWWLVDLLDPPPWWLVQI